MEGRLIDPRDKNKVPLIALIKSLQEQKVPVHAIGSQAHLNVSTSFETMDQTLTLHAVIAELKKAAAAK